MKYRSSENERRNLLLNDIAFTQKRIDQEEAKYECDHAQLAWLINHKENLENALSDSRRGKHIDYCEILK